MLTGIRQGEALRLRWQDVATKTGVIRVRFQLDRLGRLVVPKTAAAKREIPDPTLARPHSRKAPLGHASPAITLAIYAHEFARAEHADHTRKRMEQAFGSLLE